MKTLLTLALLLLTLPTQAAQLSGAVRLNSDTTGTNTTSGGVRILDRTNLYAGVVIATNRVEVGTGSTVPGYLTLSSTNGTYTLVFTVAADGTLEVNYGTTNLLQVAVPSGYAGAGTKVFTDDGTYKFLTDPPGTVVTNININPTNLRIPQRSNSTSFADTSLGTSGSDLVLLSNLTTVATLKTNGSIYLNRHLRAGPDYDTIGGSVFNSGWGFTASSSVDRDSFGRANMGVLATDSSSFNTYSLIEGTARHISGNGTNSTFVVRSLLPSFINEWQLYSDVVTTNQEFRFERNGTPGGYPIRYRPMSVLAPAAIIGSGATTAGDLLQLHNNYTNYFTVGPAGVVTLGPGTTNVLYRSGKNLVYTNGATEIDFKVINGSGNHAAVGLNAAGQTIFYSGNGASTDAGITMTAGYLIPLGGVTMDLGDAGSSTKFRNGAFSQDLYMGRRIVWNGSTNTVWDLAGGFADPNGNVPACSPGSTYRNMNGGAGATFWVKESGTGTQTGWVAK